MCGICGIFETGGHDLDRDWALDRLDRMIASLRHRGPDEKGRFCQGHVALGHARLSIIDLESGRQPMANEDGTVWVTFNGEIFNYIELRRKLRARGHVFKTRSDTEVLVHLFEEKGPGMLQELNGQFAFCIFDSKEKSILLARDHFGICPLFYTRYRGMFVFASEIKAIGALPGAGLSMDPRALAQVFTMWSVLSPRTPFKEVRSIPPGSYMWLRPGERETPEPKVYWHLSFPRRGEEDAGTSPEEWSRRVRDAMIQAVRLRLRADVPVGVYLSGGLDSSIISTVVKQLTDTPVEAFSVAFDRASYDESAYQERLASAIGVRYNRIRIKDHHIGRVFPRVVWHGERPLLRTAPAPLFELSGLVRASGFKVVLTGEGADELFGGYDIFKEDKIRRFWARRPDSECRPLLLNRLYPYSPLTTSRAGRMLYAFYKKALLPTGVFGYSHLPTWANTKPIMSYFSGDLSREIQGYDPVCELEEQAPPEFLHWHPLHQAQFLETRLLLSEYLLSSQGERMAMGHSVEGRYPFLDPQVAALACSIPPGLKLRGLNEKYILRRAFEGLLPREISRRPKRPYQAPNRESLLERPDVSRVYEILAKDRIEQAGLFDAGKVERLLRKCAAGKATGFRDNAACVGILSTQTVWELFVEKNLGLLSGPGEKSAPLTSS